MVGITKSGEGKSECPFEIYSKQLSSRNNLQFISKIWRQWMSDFSEAATKGMNQWRISATTKARFLLFLGTDARKT